MDLLLECKFFPESPFFLSALYRDAFPSTSPLSGRHERLSASVTYSQIDKLLHVFKFDHDGQ